MGGCAINDVGINLSSTVHGNSAIFMVNPCSSALASPGRGESDSDVLLHRPHIHVARSCVSGDYQSLRKKPKAYRPSETCKKAFSHKNKECVSRVDRQDKSTV